jgi:hypothetical protein
MNSAIETTRSARPASHEYAEWYAKYVARVADGDVVRTLERQITDTVALLRSLPEERGDHRYAPGKWSVRELVGHICDAERVFAYRAMRFARADETPLAGFDENAFVANARFNERTLISLAGELDAVRRATCAFFGHLEPDAWGRHGPANNNQVTVRALAWIIAGHELHHVNILRERYLPTAP